MRLLPWRSSNTIFHLRISFKIFVLPSFAEGLPVVVIENLAVGTPVATTHTAGILESGLPIQNGWLRSD
ncbi:glycosyltransferase [Roseimaritima multifibrata]